MRVVRFLLLASFLGLLGVSVILISLEAVIRFNNRVRITMSNEDVAEYAATAHVRFGSTEIWLPFVALDDYRRLNPPRRLPGEPDKNKYQSEKQAFVAAASDPARPMISSLLSVSVDGYGTLGELAKSSRICPQLVQDWAKDICVNPWHPLRQSLPSRISFFDAAAPEQALKAYGSHVKLLATMRPFGRKAKYACEMPLENKRCIAVVLIDESLAAYWAVFDRSNEAIADAAERQGRIIQEFVKLGLGKEEVYPELLDHACELREPGRVAPSSRHDLCPPG